MNDPEHSSITAGLTKTTLLVVGLLGFAIAGAGSLFAQEATPQSPQPATAYLEYREVSFDVAQFNLPTTKRAGAFTKEPPFGRNNISRGMLQLGGGSSNAMAFAWDRTAGKLYLDLNRNLNLTDDPAGVFTTERSSGPDYQSFPNVHLPVTTPAGNCQALVDVSFYGFSGVGCNAALRSFWQGKVTLKGEEWQMGLVADPFRPQPSWESGSLLLRPWSEHNQSFGLNNGSLEAFPFSPKLFVGNHAYQLQCKGETQGNVNKVRVQFTEQSPGLGELRITGDAVQRVTLEGGAYAVVLDKPGAVVKVPAGSYPRFRVCLKKGDVEAHLDRSRSGDAARISVSEQKAAELAAGGPLTNAVNIRRQGKNLLLSYEMRGAAGNYALAGVDRLMHPPEFMVYRGDKKIASGKFQYG
jgi:hypothetical protein